MAGRVYHVGHMTQNPNPYRRCPDLHLTRAGNLEEERAGNVCTHDLAKGCLVGDLLEMDGPEDPMGPVPPPGPLAVWIAAFRAANTERQNPEFE